MQTVVQLAIMVAMYMGCSPIYLIGLDHDWLSQGGKDHFYSDEADAGQTNGAGNWTYLTLMEAVTTMWKYYGTISRVAQAEGIKIVNSQVPLIRILCRRSEKAATTLSATALPDGDAPMDAQVA